MSNFFLKPFNDTYYKITRNRQSVGNVNIKDGAWQAFLRVNGGETFRVSNFSSADNAFRAIVLAYNVAKLKVSAPDVDCVASVIGFNDAAKERAIREIELNNYVVQYNKRSNDVKLRVSHRRR